MHHLHSTVNRFRCGSRQNTRHAPHFEAWCLDPKIMDLEMHETTMAPKISIWKSHSFPIQKKILKSTSTQVLHSNNIYGLKNPEPTQPNCTSPLPHVFFHRTMGETLRYPQPIGLRAPVRELNSEGVRDRGWHLNGLMYVVQVPGFSPQNHPLNNRVFHYKP